MSKGNKERERQSKEQTLSCREQTDGFQRSCGWGMGKIGDGD